VLIVTFALGAFLAHEPSTMAKRRSPTTPGTGEVRLIAGQYRGRRLPVVSVDGLRPTGDRLRETLFNWLQNDIAGARCLDAFAGSGALGFEAASRHAKSVTLVEPNREAVTALRQSQKTLDASSVEIVHQTFESFAVGSPEPFDLVFIDPPFDGADFVAILKATQSILAPHGWVYIECPKSLSEEAVTLPPEWEVRRDKCFGDVRARLCAHTP